MCIEVVINEGEKQIDNVGELLEEFEGMEMAGEFSSLITPYDKICLCGFESSIRDYLTENSIDFYEDWGDFYVTKNN